MRWPLLGDIPELVQDVTGAFARLFERYGSRAPFYMGTHRGLLLSDPEDAKRVLMAPERQARKSRYTKMMGVVFGNSVLLAEGDEWARQRGYLNPMFAPKAVGRHIPVIAGETSRLCESLSEEINNGALFEAGAQSRLLVQRIMGHILFGDLFPGEKLDRLMTDLQTVNDCLFGEFIRKSVFRGPLAHIPTVGSIRLKKAVASISAFIDDLLASNIEDDDQSLAAAIIRAAPDGENRKKEIKDQITVLFYAGQDTTARALAWIFYFLCENPKWIARLRTEAQAANIRTIEHLDLKALSSTLNVAREALRLRPVAYAIDRELADDDVLDAPDATKGVITPIAVSNVHRHPDHWSAPESFDPERFTARNAAGRHPCAYLPFGHGRRKCVGASLAELELTLITAIFCERFDFERTDKTPIRAKAAVTLAPDPEIVLMLKPVNHCSS